MPFFLDESEMENEMLIYFCWFFGGAIVYKILSYILGVGTSINLFTQTLIGCLSMIKNIDEQALIMIEERYDMLKKSGATDEELGKAKKINLQAHELWRASAVGMIISSCPSSIRNALRFKDWSSAMKLLEK